VQLGKLTEENIAKNTGARSLSALTAERRAGIRVDMQSQLQQVDLTRRETVIPAALASAITRLQIDIAEHLQHDDFAKGWTQAYSLDAESARQTADFLIYSSLPTVARRARYDNILDAELAL
jgi:nitric oxide reductase subunit B